MLTDRYGEIGLKPVRSRAKHEPGRVMRGRIEWKSDGRR
jgi:hypothetical protein